MIVAPQTTQPIEIGKFYQVPTVRGDLYGWMGNWPVIGPRHEDKEYINFPNYHYHIDWRFVSPRAYDRFAERASIRYSGASGVFAYVLTEVVGELVYRRRKCQRTFPGPYPKATWLHELSEAYSDHILDDRLICPHRGASLAGITADSDGCVTCPLHGLKWDLNTRQVVVPGHG